MTNAITCPRCGAQDWWDRIERTPIVRAESGVASTFAVFRGLECLACRALYGAGGNYEGQAA